MVEVFREKFWRLGDKVLSLPSDSKRIIKLSYDSKTKAHLSQAHTIRYAEF